MRSAARKQVRGDPLRFFAADDVERARRYHRPLYWAAAAEAALELALLATLAWTQVGDALDPTSLPWWQRTLAYAAIIVAISAAMQTPLAYWRGYLRERRWQLSTQRLGAWASDRLKATGVNIVLTSALLLGLVALARTFTGWWVVPAAAAAALAAILLSFLAPVVIAPIFNRYVPLREEPLSAELRALAATAAVPVEDVLVEDTSRRTRKANAYVAGLGRTRRLVVSDTLLAAAPPAELRTVVAHELGHRRERHLLFGTLISAAGAVAATIVVWALLGTQVADPHRLPVVLLLGFALGLAALPPVTAVSRSWERSADRYALQLTKEPAAYQSVFRRLAATNLSDLDPPAMVYFLLFTHPTTAERLAAAATADEVRSPDASVGETTQEG
jgi:STE24 endopeptidase